MNSITFSVVLVIVAASQLAVTEGLECYTCWADASIDDYPENPIEGVKGHRSCKKGLLPDESLKVACPTMKDDTDTEIKPVCAQLYLDTVLSDPTLPPAPFKPTIRGCFYPDPNIEDLNQKEDGCSIKQYEDLATLTLGPFKQFLEGFKPFLPSDVSTELCHCKTDNCNSFDDTEEPTTEQSDGGNSTECTGDKCGLAPTTTGKLSLLTGLVALSLAFSQGLF